MKRRLAELAWLVPGLAALWLFVVLLRSADLGRALELIAALGPILPVLLLPQALALGLDAFGSRQIFRSLGRSVPWRSLTAVRFAADAVFMSLPSGAVVAEALQPYLLRRRSDLSFEDALVGTVARKIFVIFSQGLFLALSVIVGYSALQAASRHAIGRAGLPLLLLAASMVLMALASTLAAMFFYGRVAQRSRNALSRLGLSWLRPWLERNAHRFGAADDHLARYFSSGPAALAAPLPFFLVMWLVRAFESWLFLSLLGTPLGFGAAMALETTVLLARVLVVPVPGGLGIQDLGYVLFLRAFGLPDVATLGAAFVLLKRGKELFWTAFGLLVFYRTPRRPSLVA
jgi:uncharacterized membrane protein YbhN (UPF0104 family)